MLSWGWGEEEEGGDWEGAELAERRERRVALRSPARCQQQLMFCGLCLQAQQMPLLSLDALREGALHKRCTQPRQSWENPTSSSPPGWLLALHYLTFSPTQLCITQVPEVTLRRCEHHESGGEPKLTKVKRGLFPPTSTGLSICSVYRLRLFLHTLKKIR